jgi:hypothetical protein
VSSHDIRKNPIKLVVVGANIIVVTFGGGQRAPQLSQRAATRTPALLLDYMSGRRGIVT